jgi:hypothetical protein
MPRKRCYVSAALYSPGHHLPSASRNNTDNILRVFSDYLFIDVFFLVMTLHIFSIYFSAQMNQVHNIFFKHYDSSVFISSTFTPSGETKSEAINVQQKFFIWFLL